MYNSNKKKSGFPDPLAPQQAKAQEAYGLQYAKAIESQWGTRHSASSMISKRNKIFDRNRDYANGTQDTNIYKKKLKNTETKKQKGRFSNFD